MTSQTTQQTTQGQRKQKPPRERVPKIREGGMYGGRRDRGKHVTGGRTAAGEAEMESVTGASKCALELLPGQKGENKREILSTVLSPQAHGPPQPAALSRQLLLVLADQARVLG